MVLSICSIELRNSKWVISVISSWQRGVKSFWKVPILNFIHSGIKLWLSFRKSREHWFMIAPPKTSSSRILSKTKSEEKNHASTESFFDAEHKIIYWKNVLVTCRHFLWRLKYLMSTKVFSNLFSLYSCQKEKHLFVYQ